MSAKRVLKTQMALDALPDGTIISGDGCAYQLSRGYWYRAFGDDSADTSWALSQRIDDVEVLSKPVRDYQQVTITAVRKSLTRFSSGALRKIADDCEKIIADRMEDGVFE